MKPESLILKGGVHTMRIDCFVEYLTQKPTCRITCVDDMSDTQDEDGNWIEENESANYYLTIAEIDKVIAKLKEAKEYIEKIN